MKTSSVLRFSLKLYGKALIAGFLCIIFDFVMIAILPERSAIVIGQLCGMALLYTLIYSTSWDIGHGDINRVACGYAAQDSFKGMKAGLIASIPGLLAGVLLFLIKATVLPESLLIIYRLFNAHYAPLNLILLPAALFVGEYGMGSIILSISTMLILPAISGLAYAIGFSGVSLIETLMYSTPQARKKHKESITRRQEKRQRSHSR